MKELLWNLFKKTGKIEYYLLYKKEVANSMLSLRTTKTLSSFTTCDDSICGGDTGHKKAKINLNQFELILLN